MKALVPTDQIPPNTGEPPHITGLRQLSQGRQEVLDRLIPLVCHELRRLARARLTTDR